MQAAKGQTYLIFLSYKGYEPQQWPPKRDILKDAISGTYISGVNNNCQIPNIITFLIFIMW